MQLTITIHPCRKAAIVIAIRTTGRIYIMGVGDMKLTISHDIDLTLSSVGALAGYALFNKNSGIA